MSSISVSKAAADRLSQWEDKEKPLAALTEKQKATVTELGLLCKRPIPAKFLEERKSAADESTLLEHSISDADLESENIENAQQFFTWFSQVQAQMLEDQEYQYREYRDEVKTFHDKCNGILEMVENVFNNLSNLQRMYDHVILQTRSLHDACEQSLEEQADLTNQAQTISDRLSYFTALDNVKYKLAGINFSISGESVIPILTTIDECITYMEQNPQYKESETFLARYRQVLNQALGLIKHHISHLLRSATLQASQSIIKERGQTGLPYENAYTSLYGKFRTQAYRVKSFMEKLEEKCSNHPEYKQCIEDCLQCYFDCRNELLVPFVTESVVRLVQMHLKNPCTLLRSGCSFLVHACQDEYQLFFEFFAKSATGFDSMLEGLCSILYETFRPIVIQLNHMETLAELCNILKVEMLEEHVGRKAEQLASFELVVAQMLEDVQERLVYKAQTYIQNDIEKYAPSPGDLAYPDKLMLETFHGPDCKEEKDSSEARTAMVDLQAMWYPTVRRTLVCLSKLYTCISKPTFEGIAQEALAVCIHTLKRASAEISKRKGSINGHLFLIKHLLILREQIAPFDVDFAVKEVALDFSKFKSAAYGLLSKGTRLLSLNSNNALLEFLLEGVPQITEYYLDSKKEVDAELKSVCESFIGNVGDSFVLPLSAHLDKTMTILKLAEEENKDKTAFLKQQPFAKPDSVRKVVSEAYMLLKSKLPSTMESMSLYLASKDTEYILFRPIRTKVLRQYKQLADVVTEHYDEDDQKIIGCPAQEQLSLLMTFH